jgi:Fe2+ transport system protein FeoA
MQLSEVPNHRATRVVSIDCARPLRCRLMEMGLLPGTEVVVLGRAPLGDPLRVKVRGYLLSLRDNEASSITVEPLDGEAALRGSHPPVVATHGPDREGGGDV